MRAWATAALRRPMVILFAAAATVTWAGCASSSGGVDGPRREQNVLTPEEIATAPVNNLYEAVERFRPRWLLVRSPRSLNMRTEVIVILNDAYLGPPESLRQVGMDGLVRLRYVDGPRASALYRVPGGTAVEGAIVVEVGRDG